MNVGGGEEQKTRHEFKQIRSAWVPWRHQWLKQRKNSPAPAPLVFLDVRVVRAGSAINDSQMLSSHHWKLE